MRPMRTFRSFLLVVAALLTSQTAFAHEAGQYNEPRTALTLIGLTLGAAAAMWSLLGYRRGIRPKSQLTLILMTMTGFIHVFVGLDGEWLLILNGLGYFALIVALFGQIPQLTPYRDYVRLVSIIYLSLSIQAYFAAHHLSHEFEAGVAMPLFGDWVGMVDKLIELPLMGLLLTSMQAKEMQHDTGSCQRGGPVLVVDGARHDS